MSYLQKANDWLDRIKQLPNSKSTKNNIETIKEHIEILEWLIQQADRAEQLEMKHENTGSIFSKQALKGRVEELEQELRCHQGALKELNEENQRYKQALEFYADPRTWRKGKHIKGNNYEMPIANKDSGEKARQELEEP